jgi:hypothetical protein
MLHTMPFFVAIDRTENKLTVTDHSPGCTQIHKDGN